MALLEVKNLVKQYKDKKAVNDVSFEVNSGEIVGLLGKNGAGKTTIMNSISGNIFQNKGEVLFEGNNLRDHREKLSNMGILIQASFFDYMNTYENLRSLLWAVGIKEKEEIDKRIAYVLELVGLSAQLKKYVKSFSFGMKQRLGLAQTLITETSFLMLDEPFVGLDPLGRELLKEIILDKAKKENVGVLFSSHDLNDVLEISDRIIVIEDGKKVFDDQVSSKKTYHIYAEDLSEHTQAVLLDKFQLQVTQMKISLPFEHRLSLNDLLHFLVEQKILIKSISVEDNALFSFFRKEA